ncbi:M42 family metallopeptidase [Alicyclobacillus sp. SO9]|uniref:M42 family metallopeptidase n=1 Tax=Alicyclobacillus sp. SO9 TaxID=2665646 RepID=UPI0018E7474E|nr:M42 family metallopeptidase [Alicyclobacillus sp. SO9]QQE81171.1 M42 family metallopeptidase [Alicyclobacillus sp. SO9]
MEYIQTLLLELLKTPSPTGDTKTIIRRLTEEVSSFGITSTTSRKGALLFTVPGEDASKARLLTGHVDTLGGMVKEILPSGRLRLTQVGGYAWNTIEGEYCEVHTESGQTITGTVILHNTAVHVNREIGKTERTQDNIEVVLDAKSDTKKEAEALGVSVGDFVYFDARSTITPSGYIKSRHLDDKASVAILFGLLREIQQKSIKLPHPVHFLISNNEEIGYGGNSNIPPETWEYLAVDMGAIGDGQTTSESCVSICAKDSSGPYHLGLRRHLVSLAEQAGLTYAVDVYPYYNSDASMAMRAGVDVKHGLIGPGVANSHAYERTHVAALDNTFKLLLAYVQSPLVME